MAIRIVAIRIVATTALALASWSATALARDAAPAPVTGCESLVSLRRLMAEAQDDGRTGDLAAYPDCLLIPRERIGAVARRTIVGGAPYECMAVRDSERCLWIAP